MRLRAQIGKGSDQYLPEFLSPDELRTFGRKIDEYRSELFRKEYLPKVKPFPKVRELFERIKADDKRIALATSSKKDDVKTYTKVARIDDLIDCEITADDADKSKSAPDVFQAALEASGVGAAAAIAVGDTRFDVEAAKQIGLGTIGLLCGRAADEETFRKVGTIAVYKDSGRSVGALRLFAAREITEKGASTSQFEFWAGSGPRDCPHSSVGERRFLDPKNQYLDL